MSELEFVLNRTERSSGRARRSSSRAALAPGVTSWPGEISDGLVCPSPSSLRLRSWSAQQAKVLISFPYYCSAGVANDDGFRLGEFSFDKKSPTPTTSSIQRGRFCSLSLGLVKDKSKGNKSPRGTGVSFKTSKAVAPWGMVVIPSSASLMLRAHPMNHSSSRLVSLPSQIFSIIAGATFCQAQWNGLRVSEAVQNPFAAASAVRGCMLTAATSLRSSVRRGQIAFAARTGESHLVAGVGMMAAVAFLQARCGSKDSHSRALPVSIGSPCLIMPSRACPRH